MKRALVLQHVWENPPGSLGDILQKYMIAYDLVDVETDPLPAPDKYDVVVALGGSQHAYDDEKHPYFVQEKALLRKIIELDIPYLGICLGAQLLARALGASVKQHTITEIGFFDVQLTEAGKADPLYAGLPGYQKVFHWHEDIFDLPQGAIHLATSKNTANEAFRYRRAYGIQYHIELTPQVLDIWLHSPACKQDIIGSIGLDAYLAIERTRSAQYSIYHRHTWVLFENFLRIHGLICSE